MRNARGVELKKGYWAWYKFAGRDYEGRLIQSFETAGVRGWLIARNGKIGSADFVANDNVAQVLPPMRVLKDGTVKANPINEARELFLYALNNWDTMQRINALGAATPALAWLKVAQTAARQYSSEHGNGASKWKEIFTDADVQVVAAMLREHFEELRANPLQRVKINSPSQLTGEPPSARLKKRRRKTATMPIPGIWANPLSRVSINSPSQRARKTATGGKTKRPSKRLTDRREYTDAMPAGFYANPAGYVDNAAFRVQVKTASGWRTVGASARLGDAKAIARAYHAAHPKTTVRVIE